MPAPSPETIADLPRWYDAAAYAFTQDLDAAHWAWEFLRRNRAYREDWQWFDSTWRSLESDYGKAPERDYFRWKQDARAWRNAAEIDGGHCADEDCASSPDEKLLIECWMGERWGFYRFPPDPHHDSRQLAAPPAWRPHERGIRVLHETEAQYFDADAGKMALGFDLALPLAQQLDEAKRLLLVTQRRLQKDGTLAPPTVNGRRQIWIACLRLLDGEQQQAGDADLARRLCAEAGPCLDELRATAYRLVESGYRLIAWFTER